MCTCSAPDVILTGCPTVLIGGASGAASPGAAAAAASAHGATASPGTPGLGATARPLSPWVGVGYQDRAGRPVTGWRYRAASGADGREGQLGSGGQVWCDALAESGAVEARDPVSLTGAASRNAPKETRYRAQRPIPQPTISYGPSQAR